MKSTHQPSPVGIWIPARLESTRLPQKLLQRAHSKPLLALTIDVALRAAQEIPAPVQVRVVTDSDKLADVAVKAGVEAIRVDQPTQSGTDRLVFAWMDTPPKDRPDILINLQGDEPLLPSNLLTQLALFMQSNPDCTVATLMHAGHQSNTPGTVHVTTDRRDKALYFSRAVIPSHHPSTPPPHTPNPNAPWGTHIGVYAYRATMMGRWFALPRGPLEEREGLEQLRILESGLPIHVLAADTTQRPQDIFSIDTPEDLSRLRALNALS